MPTDEFAMLRDIFAKALELSKLSRKIEDLQWSVTVNNSLMPASELPKYLKYVEPTVRQKSDSMH
jgi:hypothetical protein